MVTYADLARKYANMRKCRHCGLEKHAIDNGNSDFSWKKRYRVDGSYMIQYDGKCKVCRRELDRTRRIKETTQRVIFHTGPTDPLEKLFVCQLKPTEPERVKRYESISRV